MREATRQRILSEAAREFARLGFDQANINLIAEQASIGISARFLRHYPPFSSAEVALLA